MMRSNQPRTALLVVALCASPFAPLLGQTQQTLDSAYRFIKDSVERLFPLPKARDTATVGTFDAKTGRFTWRRPLESLPPAVLTAARLRVLAMARAARQRAHRGMADPAPDPVVQQAGEIDPRIPELPVNATNVDILFNIANPGSQGVQAVVNGATFTAAPGQTILAVPVKDAVEINFELHGTPDPATPAVRPPSSRPQVFAINHHPYPIAGAFTLQAVPISILFALPQYGKDSSNTATKSAGVTVSSSFTTSMSSEQSTTSDTRAPMQYDDLMTYKDDLSVISQAFSAFVSVATLGQSGDAVSDMNSASRGVSGLLSIVDKALGSASATRTDASIQTNGRSLTVRDAQASTLSATTAAKTTPGVGDRISYLHNVRFAYLAYYPCANCDVELFLTPLSGGTPDLTTPVLLKDDLTRINAGQAPQSGFTKSTIQFLLGFDPFVDQNDMLELDKIDPSRFVREETYPVVLGSSDADKTYTHEVTRQDSHSAVSSTTIAQELRPGFLCFLGIGVTTATCDPVRSSIKVSTTNSTIHQNNLQKTETWKVHLATSDPHVKYYVTGYYDRVLGTFAFSRDTGEAVSGVVRDNAQQPVANQLVTLSFSGGTTKTRTDSQGRYSFGGHQIKPGQATIQVEGGAPKPVVLGRQALVQDLKKDR